MSNTYNSKANNLNKKDKPLQCSNCGWVFSKTSNLNKHIKDQKCVQPSTSAPRTILANDATQQPVHLKIITEDPSSLFFEEVEAPLNRVSPTTEVDSEFDVFLNYYQSEDDREEHTADEIIDEEAASRDDIALYLNIICPIRDSIISNANSDDNVPTTDIVDTIKKAINAFGPEEHEVLHNSANTFKSIVELILITLVDGCSVSLPKRLLS
ncbi:unnamed protein product [Rhizopus stolonifer]